MNKTVVILSLFICSWAIVAFGQPATVPMLGLIAAVVGFALFWRAMVFFQTAQRRFLIALFWFASVQAVQLSWMTSVELVGELLLLAHLLFCLVYGIQFALVSLLIPPQGGITIRRMLSIAALWTLFEWGRLQYESGFSWNPIGLELTGNVLSLQLVSLLGVYGLTFWVIFVNLLAYDLMIARTRIKIVLWSSAVVIPYLYGLGHLTYHEQKMASVPPQSIHILAVQPGILPGQHNPNFTPLHHWDLLLKAMKPYLNDKFDLVLFPESVVPYPANIPIYPYSLIHELFSRHLEKDIRSLLPLLPHASAIEKNGVWYVGNGFLAQMISNQFSADLIAGFEDIDKSTEEKSRSYQAALHFKPAQNSTQRYEKRVLVPMGEYIPFEWCKSLAARYGIYDSFAHGEKAKLFHIAGRPMGMSICYEETYGHLMKENRQLGAVALVNITNDGWYPNSRLPRQHFEHARPRCVENGIPLIRACNTGVTAVIDSLGRTIAELPTDKEDPGSFGKVLIADVPLYQYETLYSRFGDYPIVGLCALILILSLLGTYGRNGRDGL